ncbi:MAG: glycerol kinase GlpK [Clostridia bacterium]|nr:glycerol kinase GlpK [Clostridia bacterium]
MMKYILALDQGTTSSRAIVFNKQGEIVGSAQQEFEQVYPKVGWVEHQPKEILGSQVGAVSEALVKAGITAQDLEAIGITNQRETTIVWDKKTGVPIYNAIVWQCRRTAEYCNQLKAEGYSQMIFDKTGLVVDAYFSATKAKWILDNVEGARQKANKGELLFGTVDTYLMWYLSKGKIHATDFTNASRTMLFNIHTLEWDDELLKLFDIPKSMMPQVYPSSYDFGKIDSAFLGAEIPICGVAGDQQASLFGQLCTDKGSVKNTFGTGCFMLMNTGEVPVVSKHGLVTTLAVTFDKNKPTYALEGSVFMGGAVIKWMRDEMKLIYTAQETETYASKVSDTNGVYIVPAFVGLGAPWWDSDCSGIITGLTRGATKEHFVRAGLECIAYQVYDVMDAMQKDSGIKITSLNVDGGASANDFLMQFQADLLDCAVLRPKVVETTALGVAYLSGLKAGYWKDVQDIKNNVTVEKIFNPNMQIQKRQQLLYGWKKAVKQTLCK